MPELICDFCSTPEIYGAFDCDDFVTAIGAGSQGPWAACHVCYDLVNAGQWDTLLNHSMTEFSRKYGVVPPPAFRSWVRDLHEQFRQHHRLAN